MIVETLKLVCVKEWKLLFSNVGVSISLDSQYRPGHKKFKDLRLQKSVPYVRGQTMTEAGGDNSTFR